ncbi:hypothetical protein TRVL_05851 [Trypanosoma vivax]|uniref:Uncharacterized protein n=1 Tax=Trypanosoma vivax (strain Y486) TaxID=1055687 RepID=G0TTJ4_TRYVY|nr:hypothetical protein TRVL_05851 [Trypanosoma vivax]CCC47275.1 conserved hypothetical protein [Trypanosoma vivax Y486]
MLSLWLHGLLLVLVLRSPALCFLMLMQFSPSAHVISCRQTMPSDSSPSETCLSVAADISRAKNEMNALSDQFAKGEAMGQLLRKRVALQHRIQRLLSKERELKNKSFTNKCMEMVPRRRSASLRKNRARAARSVTIAQTHGALNWKESITQGSKKSEAASVSVAEERCMDECPSVTTTTPDASRHARINTTCSNETQRVCDNSIASSAREKEEEANVEEEDIGAPSSMLTEFAFITAGLDKRLLTKINATAQREMTAEAQTETVRHAREAKLKETEARRQRSTRRFDLVEDMYAKAIERRMRAMRKIAMDPPADRLIGNNGLQHIPLSILPAESRKVAENFMPLSVTRAAAYVGSSYADTVTVTGKKNFFLTGVDAALSAKRPGDVAVTGPNNEEEPSERVEGSEESHSEHDKNNVRHEELLRQWRELGYTAVFLPASNRLVCPFEDSITKRKSSHDPNAWMKLRPLPFVHLIQRRLPEEALRHSALRASGRRQRLPTLSTSNQKIPAKDLK